MMFLPGGAAIAVPISVLPPVHGSSRIRKCNMLPRMTVQWSTDLHAQQLQVEAKEEMKTGGQAGKLSDGGEEPKKERKNQGEAENGDRARGNNGNRGGQRQGRGQQGDKGRKAQQQGRGQAKGERRRGAGGGQQRAERGGKGRQNQGDEEVLLHVSNVVCMHMCIFQFL